MKNLLKKIDHILFRGLFIKIYGNLYWRYRYKIYKIQSIFSSSKKQREKNKKNIIRIKNLKQYKFLSYWNNHFNHLSANDVKGDIVECGVGNGETLSYMLFNLIYNKKHSNRKYIGFDSFEGFPEPSDEDKSPRNPEKGDWNHTNEKFVISNLNDLGFEEKDFKKIKFIKGFFERTFQQEKDNIKTISLLHIDCDLYSSTKISLETWFDKVEKNGLIVFDEYLNSAYQFPGALKAIDEFLGTNKSQIKICPYTKQYYLIKS